jgi:plastocyanin
MRPVSLWLPALSLALVPLALPTSGPRPVAAKAVVVKMIDVSATAFKYDPATVTVSPGDTLRFTQTGKTPHNVDFKATPTGVDLGPAKMGPFLTSPEQTYDLVLDARFPAGVYQFACTPHEMLGMKGSFTVQAK